ncbi:MAG: TIGR02391 family protein [Candidatus Nomurabacteria bacterium]|nr:TIGR02391 family protein [Candidatus Nomurabacteria bacterium]
MVLMEAWMWLEVEGFLAPQPGTTDGWSFVTRKGKKILQQKDFSAYQKGSLLPSSGLDPVLVEKVKPTFIRGDYETAVFQAFREVEVRVRLKAGLAETDIGIELMSKAFKANTGLLTDKVAPVPEQLAKHNLFSGAIGFLKNPTSHRVVSYNDPNEVADLIRFANQLLRLI